MNKIHIAAVALLLLTACATEEAAKKPADVLYSEAQNLGKGKRYDRAVERYQSLRTFYPGHELAKRSLIDLGDLYYRHEEYDQAAVSYNEFRLLYPTDPEAAYCLFRIGLCSFNRLQSFDRDQSLAYQTVQVLSQFVELYPNSPYGDEARSDINVARSLIARQELAVAEFYVKKKKYRAACERLASVAANYGDLGFDSEIAELRAKCCGKPEPVLVPTLYGHIRTFLVEHPLPWMQKPAEAGAATEPASAGEPAGVPQADERIVPVQPETGETSAVPPTDEVPAE